jgi:hypothetical protein
MNTRFWVVWNEHGGPPRVRHDTQASARREAHRLATNNAGETFIHDIPF